MYKFQTLNSVFLYHYADKLFVDYLNKENPHVWDGRLPNPPFLRGSRTKRDDLKNFIKNKLTLIQGDYCIYCGVKFRTKSEAQREHILPKETYPEYTFEAQNLVLACSRCNGFDFKHIKDYAVVPVVADYHLNNFEIIHPYLDNLHDHLDVSGVVLAVKDNSPKGHKTIDEFQLNDEYNCNFRGGDIYRKKYEISDGTLLTLVSRVIKFIRR